VVTFELGAGAAEKSRNLLISLAEAVRFELTNPFGLPVFKTGAIDHSATLPMNNLQQISRLLV
jgi:hypothetical protein